ncbi:MAG: hypothetical protein K0R26_1929 [Bacteroidota bacterium]|jgi:hypothetical protein|nr:hypothetical protein [Bacteroidota bacterium]
MLNYSNESRKLNDSLSDMQKQIDSLKNDLDYYRQNPKANAKVAFFKEQQIKIFAHILESFYEFKDNTDILIQQQQKENAILADEKFKLEGVCLIHGISNLPYYMRMKTAALIKLVQQAFNENWRQTPFEIKPHSTPQERLEILPYNDLIKRTSNSHGEN